MESYFTKEEAKNRSREAVLLLTTATQPSSNADLTLKPGASCFFAGRINRRPLMPHSHPPANRALPRLREEPCLLFTSNLTPPISSKTIWTKFLFWRCVSHSVVSNSSRPHGLLACQFPLSMEFFRQDYWSGLPFPSPGDHPNPGTGPGSLVLQADSLQCEPPRKPQVGAYWAACLPSMRSPSWERLG